MDDETLTNHLIEIRVMLESLLACELSKMIEGGASEERARQALDARMNKARESHAKDT